MALAAEADTNTIDTVVDDAAELEVSTVDSVAVAPSDDTEESLAEGGEAPVVAAAETEGDMSDTDVVPNGAAQSAKITVVVKDDSSNYNEETSNFTFTGATEITPTGDDDKSYADYKFTIVPKTGYKLADTDGLKCYTGAEADQEIVFSDSTENEYTINGTALDSVVGDTDATLTIVVKTEEKKFSVTENISPSDAATIAYTSGVTDSKVQEGQEITFKVNPPTEGSFDGKKVTVTYTVTAAEKTDVPLTAVSDVYTIPGTDVKGDVTINVTVGDIPTRDVTLYEYDTVKDKVTLSYAIDPSTDFTDYEAAVPVTEGKTFKFKLAPKDPYQVAKVEINDEEVTAQNEIYSVVVTEATTIKVTTEYNPAKVNQIKFESTQGTDKGSYKVTVALTDDGTADWNTADDYADKTFLSKETKFTVTIEANESYGITGVSVDDKAEAIEEGKDSHSVTVEFASAAGGVKNIKVTTAPKGSEKAANVTFQDNAANVELSEVKVDDKAVIAGEDGKYAVEAGSKRLEFALVATGSYVPVVTGSTATPELKGDPVTKNNKTTYTYSVLASALDENETFTIEEKADMKTITIVSEGDGKATVVQSINGKATEDTEVLSGTVVTFQVTASDNSNLKSVKVGDKDQKITNKKTSEFTVTVSENTTITVTTEGLYKASALKDYAKGTDLEPVKNVYNVSYDGKYAASVIKGEDNEVVLSEVKVKNTSTKKDIAAEDLVAFENGNKTAVIDLAKAVADGKNVAAGQKLTVELYVADNTTPVATYSLSVSKVITTITLQATASQAVGTVNSYKISTDGELDKLTVSITNPDAESADQKKNVVKEAEIVDGMLQITTGLDKGEAEVKVATGDTEDAISKTIKVTTTALIHKDTKAPTVKLKAASDVSFKLTLGSKVSEKLAEDGGKVYYEIKAVAENPSSIPKTGESEDAQPKLEAEVVQYTERTKDSEDVDVVVGKSSDLGSGAAWTYTVTVSLVHANGTPIKDNIVKFDGADSRSKEGKATCKTQTPAYETNLKLKKGDTTTVYTGQSNVKVAIPQFSKTTTYAVLEKVEDTSFGGDYALDLEFDKDYNIIASAHLAQWDEEHEEIEREGTEVGKHVIKVTAKAPGTMYASTATITINVVRGIEDLGVTVPSYSVYKAPNKAATLKATPKYNYGYIGSYWTPKTKKVTWLLSDFEGKEATSILGGMVSIDKNGKVTVNKNYTLKANDEENKFRIKVMANDFDGNGTKTVGYSDPIEITNKGADVKTLAVVLSGTVTAVPNGKNPVPVEASKVSWGYVKAFTSAATDLAVDKHYDDLSAVTVPVSNLTFKSSNTKVLTVSSSGYISVLKPGKVKLTATANDGSKAKAELSLNVGYDSTGEKDLRLAIYPITTEAGYEDADWDNPIYNAYDPGNSNPSSLTFSGSDTARLAVVVAVKTDDGYTKAPNFTNYKLTVDGGKVTNQWGNGAYITTNKRVTKIKLTDNTTGDNKEYTLTNTAVSEATAKPTVKVAGSLHKFGKVAEQFVTFNLSKVAVTVPEGSKLAAKVEVDWTAMKNTNQWDLIDFAGKMDSKDLENKAANNVFVISDYANQKGSFKLTFAGEKDDYIRFYQNSYKLKVTLGTVNGEGTFTAAAAAANATVKVTKTKTFTYKPTTSYKFATRDGGAVLTGKANIPAEDLNVRFDTLLNANIKGVENNFRDWFEISADNKLVLKKGVEPSTIDKKDLTGYITYYAVTNKGYYNYGKGTGKNTVKITVTVNYTKSIAKYAVVGKPEIGNTKNSKTKPITVTINKNAAAMKYAVVNGTTGWDVAVTDGNDEGVDPGKIILTYTGDEALKVGKSFSVKLLVVPEGSFYQKDVEDAKAKEEENQGAAYQKAMADYGAKLTVSVKTVAAAADDKGEEDEKSALEVAQEKLNTWLAKVSKEAPVWLKSDLTSEQLINKIKDEENGAGLDSAVAETLKIANKEEPSGTPDYTIEPATLEDPGTGSITGTLEVTVGEEPGTVAINLVLPKGAIAKSETENAIKTASSVTSIEVKSDSDMSEKGTAIKDEAQAVLGEKYYTVEIASPLKITEQPQESQDGKASITLNVKDNSLKNDTSPQVVMIEYTIAKTGSED